MGCHYAWGLTCAHLCAGERIAFEVDGPHHFTANTLAVTGEMLARQKLLRARGWHVVSVPFFRWAGRSDEARAQWLLQARLVCTSSRRYTTPVNYASILTASRRCLLVQYSVERLRMFSLSVYQCKR